MVSAGAFTSVDGIDSGHIARLTANGGVDASFRPGTIPKADVRSIALQTGGKILVGGSFHSVQGMTRNGVARLNPDGSLDQHFDPGRGTTDGSVWGVTMTKDGKVLIAGVFRDFNGMPCGRIARLNGDSARVAK